MLGQMAEIRDASPPGQPRTLAVVPKRKGKELGDIRLTLDRDGKSPKSVSFHVAGVEGTIRLNAWHFDAPAYDAMFEPPAGLRQQKVPQDDLRRMMSALVNFALESAP
jgi:hypothetical protein